MVSPTIDLVIQFALMFAIGAAMAIAVRLHLPPAFPQEQEPQQGPALRVRRRAQGRRPGALNVHYYLVAVLFVLFDLEAVFIYPWAVSLRDSGHRRALVEMFVFIAILLVGYFYAWKKGVFEWE